MTITAPVVFAERGYLGVSEEDAGALISFDLTSGREIWTSTTHAPIEIPPAVGRGTVVTVTTGRRGSTA